MSLTRYQT
ncbi:hypothetical protein LINPERPRIM_LOCUS2587 [Linum perenne]